MRQLKISTEEAVKEISELVEVFNKLKSSAVSTGNAGSKSFQELEKVINGLTSTSKLMIKEFAVLEQKYANMSRSQKSFVTQTRNLRKEKQELINTLSATNNKLLQAESRVKKLTRELDNAKTKTKTTSKGFFNLSASLSNLIGAFGILAGAQLFANLIRDVYKLAKTFDSLGFALERVSKTALDYSNNQAFLMGLVDDFGVSLVDTTERYTKFMAAAEQSGLSMKSTEKIFRSMTKASAVLGLRTDELRGVYLALEQMLSKGKITTEELRRQLGERLPGAMGIMAASMNVTIPELDKMMKKGEVLSAEVLPGFADAVELAFGIETVDKVNTLVSAENRMIARWQDFVRIITSDTSIIVQALEKIALAFEGMAFFSGEPEERVQSLLEKYNDINEKRLETKAIEIIDEERLEQGLMSYKKLEEEIKRVNKEKELLGEHEPEFAEKQKELTDLMQERMAVTKQLGEVQIDIAKKGYDAVKDEYILRKQIFEDSVARIDEIKDELKLDGLKDALYVTNEEQKLSDELDLLEKNLGNVTRNLSNALSNFQLYRKFVNGKDGEPQVLPEDPTKLKVYEVGDVNVNQYDLLIELKKAEIQLNNELIKSDMTTYTQKRDYMEEIIELEQDILDIEEKKKKEQAQAKHDSDIDKLEKGILGADVVKGDPEQYRKDRAEQLKNDLLAIEQEFVNKRNQIHSSGVERIVKFDEKIAEEKIKAVEDEYNQLIAKEIEIYNNKEKPTKKDKEELEKNLTKLRVEMANKRIDAIIDELKAELQLNTISEDRRKELERMINYWEANRQYLSPPDGSDGEPTWADYLSEVQKVVGEIGNLMDTLHDARIESINAEISQLEYLYKKRKDLARNDALQQEQLQRELDAKKRVLERKRLKEEQKQARTKKLFNIADVIMNTAVGISRATADGALWLIPFIAALGAVQLATVVATPIPKYAEGTQGKGITEDHLGMINDAGQKEYIERDGKILSSNEKNAVVGLKKDDIVYKNYDDMLTRSLLLNGLFDGVKVPQQNFNDVFEGLAQEIKKGFKDAEIKNDVKLYGFDAQQEAYRKSLSRWN